MRRLLILFFWLFKLRNNVTFAELINFLIKPTMIKIGGKYIQDIKDAGDSLVITFITLSKKLYWPKKYPVNGIYQVAAETFDPDDWHYYQKEHTEIAKDEILLDVGAAEGLFSLSVVDLCEKVIMIEPNKHFVSSLEKTFSDFRNKVEIINVAVGEEEGEMYFDSDSLQGKVGNEVTDSNKMKITTVDSLMRREKRITYFKADIEGFEYSVLKGSEATIKKHHPKIAITTYHTENNAAEIISLIKEFVPEYNHYVKGIHHHKGKPVMIHFWI
jgi:FkbM family methyltransferase